MSEILWLLVIFVVSAYVGYVAYVAGQRDGLRWALNQLKSKHRETE